MHVDHWRIVVVCAACLVGSIRVDAAFEVLPVGPRMSVFGPAGYSLMGDLPASLRNPGLLASVPSRTLAVFYSPGLYGLTDMQRTGAVYCEPFESGGFAVGVERFGRTIYSETTLHGVCGFDVGRLGSVGVSLRFCNLSIQGYGACWVYSLSLGARVKIAEQLDYGISIENIFSTRIGESGEQMPHCVSMACSYLPVKNVRLAVGLEYDMLHRVSGGVAFEYLILDVVALRGGIMQDPDTYALGAGVRYSIFQVDYSICFHSILGASHMIALTLVLR